MPSTTKVKPIKLIEEGILSLKKIIPPNTVKTTSPDWSDSIIANSFEFLLTISVALKNNIVAITPEKIATIND